MIIRLNSQICKVLYVLIFIATQSALLQAQSWSDNFNYKDGSYHRKTGWINSVGFYTGNLDEIIDGIAGIPENITAQVEFHRYKLIKPKIGIGGGIAYSLIPTVELGYEDYHYYQFLQIYGYGKLFLNNKRRRLFVDAKLGFVQPMGKISYGCYGGCGSLKLRYSSSPLAQPGIGFDFAKSRRFRGGIKLSSFHGYITEQFDIPAEYWEYTSEGVIKRRKKDRFINNLMIGVNFYW